MGEWARAVGELLLCASYTPGKQALLAFSVLRGG